MIDLLDHDDIDMGLKTYKSDRKWAWYVSSERSENDCRSCSINSYDFFVSNILRSTTQDIEYISETPSHIRSSSKCPRWRLAVKGISLEYQIRVYRATQKKKNIGQKWTGIDIA